MLTRARRWTITLLLLAVATTSLSCGMTSVGIRGLVLGLVVPACCVAGVSAVHGLLPAFGVAALSWAVGLLLASRIGSNVVGDVINLWPFFVGAGLLLAGCLGLLCRLCAEILWERWAGRRRRGR